MTTDEKKLLDVIMADPTILAKLVNLQSGKERVELIGLMRDVNDLDVSPNVVHDFFLEGGEFPDDDLEGAT